MSTTITQEGETMLHQMPTPKLWMGRGEWLGECLRLLGQATDDRPLYTTDGSTNGRFDWTQHADTRTETYTGYSEYRFEQRRHRH